MSSGCSVNATDLEFLSTETNSSFLQLTRWMNFCRVAYVEKCDVYSMTPPPRDIQGLFKDASYDDCFNTRTLVAYCISIILTAAIICTNTAILIVFIRYKSLRTCSNIPIMSLAVSDFLTGVAFTYSSVWNLVLLSSGYSFDIQKSLAYLRMRTNYFLCLTMDGTGLVFTCLMSSVLTLGVIAIERHIGVFYPFKYTHWITTRRMVRAIVLVWVVSLVVGILPLCGWNNWANKCQLTDVLDHSYIVMWTSICFVSGVIIMYIYLRIFILSQKHSRQIAAVQISSCSGPSTFVNDTATSAARESMSDDHQEAMAKAGEEVDSPKASEADVETGNILISIQGLKKSMFIIPSKESLEKETSDQGKENSSVQPQSPAPQEVPNHHITHDRRPEVRNKPSRRALVTTMAILGAFYLCWSPLLIFLVAFRVTTTMNLITYYLALVTQLNSIFNPIVYGIRNPDIREALHKLFRCRN